jgi:iron complex outermembrane recepter protein
MKTYFVYMTFLFFTLLLSSNASAQIYTLSGTVVDANNKPIVGAFLVSKGAENGAITDDNGVFSIKIKKGENTTLVISFIGFSTKELVIPANYNQNTPLRIQLDEETKELDELIVTGVFDGRKRIESSIAISTLDNKILDRVVSNSAIELLRQVPGVYTNTSRGEIYNYVIVRGMVLGNYVSIQEDGLPIVPAPIQISPDGFLRVDVNLNRLEAVRGGTASILGANAPGGIFNYISKTGTDTFSGEVRTRFGLEGNLKNPYYRMEAGFGGPLRKKDNSLTYYIGGHYRHANGAKYPGYPLSRGGQMKGNIVKKYENGFIQLGLKYLNDRTAQFELTPTTDFENPKPPGDFTNTTSTLNPLVTLNFPASILGGLRGASYDSKNLNHYTEIAPSLNWEHRFGDGWKVQNAFRYSDKLLLTNSSFIVYPFSVDKFFFYAINGWLGKPGTYNFYNTKTKKPYGSVKQEFDFTNPDFPFKFTSNLNLPGTAVQPNSVFYSSLGIEENKSTDFMNQLTIKKQFDKMGFTAGMFYTNTKVQQYLYPPAGTGFGTIEDKPQFVGIDYIPEGTTKPIYRLTDPNGVSNYGSGGLFFDKATVRQTAFFLGHNWDISDRLNVDWGVRYERFYVNDSNVRTAASETSKGGIDGDSTTLYDNDTYKLGDYINYKSTLNTFAFSGGLNYKINNHIAFYTRYSNGSKTPNYNVFYASGATFNIEPQRTVQIELGVKLTKGRNNVFVTPFYSALDKIPYQDRGQNDGRPVTFYPLKTLYNKTHAVGVEIEGNYVFDNHWSIRASGMVQQFTADKYQFYDTRQNGPADDTLIDRSHKKISSAAPPAIFTITPTYTHHNFFANINWYYMGKRAANSSETFYLPAYSQIDLNFGYAISPKIQLQASINNVINKFGIADWSAPTSSGLPFETFDIEAFSPQKRAADPNAIYYSSINPSRSFWLSLAWKF